MKKITFILLSTLVLSAGAATSNVEVFTGQTIHASTQTAKSVTIIYYDIEDMSTIKEETISIDEGETKTIDAPAIDGYRLSDSSDGISGSASVTISYDMVKDAVEPVVGFYYKKAANTNPPKKKPYINNSTETIGVIVYYVGKGADGTTKLLVDPAPLIEVEPGEEVSAPRNFDGYTLVETEYLPPVFSEGMLTYFYESTTTTPPTQQPIEILVTHLVPPASRGGGGGMILEQTTIALNPGGRLSFEPKQFSGYTVVTPNPVTLSYDEAAAGKTSVTFSYKAIDTGGGNGGGTQTPPGNPGGGGTQTPPTSNPSGNQTQPTDSGNTGGAQATTASSSSSAATSQKLLPHTGEKSGSLVAGVGILFLVLTSFLAFKPRKN